jgi:Zn-dependent protease
MEMIDIAMILILIFSVVLHEMAHGYAASWLGDPTARLAGRLTANPIPHLDPLGSVILPGILIYMNSLAPGSGLLFGWAKPVPYNPYNFTNQKWGEAIVAFAGPASNILLAIIFGTMIRFSEVLQLSASFVQIASMVVVLNIFLALFNLLPIPPLDGSKILPKFLPLGLSMKYEQFRRVFEQNIAFGFGLVILLFIFVLSQPLLDLTRWLAALMSGSYT